DRESQRQDGDDGDIDQRKLGPKRGVRDVLEASEGQHLVVRSTTEHPRRRSPRYRVARRRRWISDWQAVSGSDRSRRAKARYWVSLMLESRLQPVRKADQTA